MRIAGSALGISDLDKGSSILKNTLASEDWPSINDPAPQPNKTDVYYDEDMGVFAPVVEKADAGNILREYGNALLSPILGEEATPFGRTNLFGGKSMMESARDSVNKINSRNKATEDAIEQLLGR